MASPLRVHVWTSLTLVWCMTAIPYALSAGAIPVEATISPEHLEADYVAVGHQRHHLRLRWRLRAKKAGDRGFHLTQAGFRTVIECHTPSSEASLAAAISLDSGIVWSNLTQHVFSHSDVALHVPAHTRCLFKVKVWPVSQSADVLGPQSSWVSSDFFATLPANNTLAPVWITSSGASEDANTTLFRKSFVSPSAVTAAVLSISGLGQYELTINSKRVGDHMMDPGWTKYTVNGTCLFATYDVTSMLNPSAANVIGVFVGNGMYNNVGPRYHKWQGSSGPRTLALQLSISSSTSTTSLVSDDTWETSPGPITFNGVYGGEDFDNRLSQPGWDAPNTPVTAGWSPAIKATGPGCTLKPQLQPPIKIREQMPTPNVTSFGQGVYSYDFKQEFSGWPVLTVNGSAGTVIRMTPAEFTTNNMPDQHFGPAYWQYTLKGGGVEVYRPRFFTYGFRYLKVEVIASTPPAPPGPPGPPGPLPSYRFIHAPPDTDVYYENTTALSKNHVGECDMCGISICHELVTVSTSYQASLKTGPNFSCSMLPNSPSGPSPQSAGLISISGEFVYSSAPIVGNFSCSNTLFNRIHNMILAAMKSNLQSIFHDCPHRERLGWLEQSWLLAKSVGHNFDISKLYAKMLGDMDEAQQANGMVPDIAPEYVVFQGGFRDSPEWGIAFPMVTAFLFDEYNDTASLSQFYMGITKYIDYLTSRADPKTGLVKYGLGDWVSAGDHSPIGVTASMVYYEGLRSLERLARVLGNSQDAARFAQQAMKVAAGYNSEYANAKSDGGYANSQTATAMALTLNVTADASKSTSWLLSSLAGANNHSLCGEIGWPYIVRSLAANNGDAVLNAIVSKLDNPSYGYNLEEGATTLTETWDAKRTSSWNHAMLGHIDAWFFEHIAGVKETSVKKPLVLFPRPIGNLTSAEVFRMLPTGRAVLQWDIAYGGATHNAFTAHVEVPPSALVHLVLPTRSHENVNLNGRQLLSVGDDVTYEILDQYAEYPGITLRLAPGSHSVKVNLEL